MIWLLMPFTLGAQTEMAPKVLVVTSYNPDTQSTASHLSAFVDEYNYMGGQGNIIVESINCQNLSGLFEWRQNLYDVLEKHVKADKPELVILMGQ